MYDCSCSSPDVVGDAVGERHRDREKEERGELDGEHEGDELPLGVVRRQAHGQAGAERGWGTTRTSLKGVS